jgi:hypothetical protein
MRDSVVLDLVGRAVGNPHGPTKPISIDLVIADGGSKGKIQLGVVEVTDDTMTLIHSSAGRRSPPG